MSNEVTNLEEFDKKVNVIAKKFEYGQITESQVKEKLVDMCFYLAMQNPPTDYDELKSVVNQSKKRISE